MARRIIASVDAAIFDNSVGPNTFMNNIIIAVMAQVGNGSTCFFEANDTSKFSPSGFDLTIFFIITPIKIQHILEEFMR